MLGRLILIAIAVLVVLWLIRRALAGPGPAQQRPGQEQAGELVACAHCGVNLPRSEARTAGGRHYCSEEHWRLGPKER